MNEFAWRTYDLSNNIDLGVRKAQGATKLEALKNDILAKSKDEDHPREVNEKALNNISDIEQFEDVFDLDIKFIDNDYEDLRG